MFYKFLQLWNLASGECTWTSGYSKDFVEYLEDLIKPVKGTSILFHILMIAMNVFYTIIIGKLPQERHSQKVLV